MIVTIDADDAWCPPTFTSLSAAPVGVVDDPRRQPQHPLLDLTHRGEIGRGEIGVGSTDAASRVVDGSRLGGQLLAMVGMSDRDERLGALLDRPSSKLGDPVLGDDLVDRVLGGGDDIAGSELRHDAGGAVDVVECSTTNPWPPSEYMAPRAKSFWPPDDEKYFPPIVSDAHWPRKSTVEGRVDRDEVVLAGDDAAGRSRSARRAIRSRVLVEELVRRSVPSANVPTTLVRLRRFFTPLTTPDSMRSTTPSDTSSVWTPRSLWSDSEAMIVLGIAPMPVWIVAPLGIRSATKAAIFRSVSPHGRVGPPPVAVTATPTHDLGDVDLVAAERARHVVGHFEEDAAPPDETCGVVAESAEGEVAVPIGW